MRFVVPLIAMALAPILALPSLVHALTILGVQPVAFDQPQVHMLLRREQAHDPALPLGINTVTGYHVVCSGSRTVWRGRPLDLPAVL